MGRKVMENPNNCSLVHAMNIIGGKWKPIILYILANESLRFGKLLFLLPSISKKVLTEQLRELEGDGLIHREKFQEIPPRVEYSLTEIGKDLLPILKQISDWTQKSYNEIPFETCRILEV